MHPESGKEIRAGLGRFGPYIVHDGDFRSLKGEDDLFTITLTRSLEILTEPKGTRRGTAAVLKTLGNHPKDNKPITLHQGKFGPYVKHGATNATIPKTESIDTLTLERALALLDERKAKGKTKRTKKET
jgi:DNA topoisomerase-1